MTAQELQRNEGEAPLDVNPYEVLGVRPSAGSDEIELAYKGRRSQYHPDRYTEADAETRDWATEKMKEVNAAYRILTSPEERAALDAKRARSAEKAPSETPVEPPPIDLEDLLFNSKWSWVFDKIYIRSRIPRGKFEGARASYAPGVGFEDVLILVDDTVFGGAREGMLVTRDGLYAKELFEEPMMVRWDKVRDVSPGASRRVLINGVEFFKATVVDHGEIQELASRIGSALKLLRGQSPVPSPKAPPQGSAPRATDLQSIYRLHRRALTSARDQLNDETMLIDMLIDDQMVSLIPIIPTLEKTAASFVRRGDGPIEAEMAEGILGVFLALHYFSLSQLPQKFRSGLGAGFSRLHECSEAYRLAYAKQFPVVFQRPFSVKEDDLMAMALMFFHHDDDAEFDLRLPRGQTLESILTRMGLKPNEARDLVFRFVDLANAWLPKLYAHLARNR